MKRISLILTFLLLLSLNSAHAYTNVAFSIGFQNTLAPYGTWVSVANYGQVWRPAVAVGWRPFTYGHWIYTSAGPYWDGYEPYAWCVYHYGRWAFVDGGWCWVPGYVYSPAPVTWAYGDGFIGWSPIYGYNGFDVNFWIFVDGGHFGFNNYAGIFLPAARVSPLFQQRAVRIVNGPLQARQIESITGHRVQVVSTRQRVVTVDGHRTRMLVTRNNEAAVMKHVAQAAKARNVKVAEKTKTQLRNAPRAEMKTAQNRHEVIRTRNGHATTMERKTMASVRQKSHATRRMAMQSKSHGSTVTHRASTHMRNTLNARNMSHRPSAPARPMVHARNQHQHPTNNHVRAGVKQNQPTARNVAKMREKRQHPKG